MTASLVLNSHFFCVWEVIKSGLLLITVVDNELIVNIFLIQFLCKLVKKFHICLTDGRYYVSFSPIYDGGLRSTSLTAIGLMELHQCCITLMEWVGFWCTREIIGLNLTWYGTPVDIHVDKMFRILICFTSCPTNG